MVSSGGTMSLKSKFLEGKRNRRVDHLLYVLLDQVIPYYIARERRQELGFEGPNLEVKKRREISERGLTVTKELISEVEAGEIYHVRSQTGLHFYTVDVDSYTCECLSYPLIQFCKHLAAVQHHFPAACRKEIFTCDTNMLPEDPADHVAMNMNNDSDDGNDNDSVVDDAEMKVSDLINKLQHLAVRTRMQRPFQLTEALSNLDQALNTVLDELGHSRDVDKVLPKCKKVAPNQHTWTETAAVMGANVKGKRKTIHTDPYSGKEASGKKARPDAREPLKRRKVDNTVPPRPAALSITDIDVDPVLLGHGAALRTYLRAAHIPSVALNSVSQTVRSRTDFFSGIQQQTSELGGWAFEFNL
jgi:hypothetical protein